MDALKKRMDERFIKFREEMRVDVKKMESPIKQIFGGKTNK